MKSRAGIELLRHTQTETWKKNASHLNFSELILSRALEAGQEMRLGAAAHALVVS